MDMVRSHAKIVKETIQLAQFDPYNLPTSPIHQWSVFVCSDHDIARYLSDLQRQEGHSPATTARQQQKIKKQNKSGLLRYYVPGDKPIIAQTIEYLQQLALLCIVHTRWEEGIHFLEYTHVDDGIGAGNSFGADDKYGALNDAVKQVP
jgi:hypothetical protein